MAEEIEDELEGLPTARKRRRVGSVKSSESVPGPEASQHTDLRRTEYVRKRPCAFLCGDDSDKVDPVEDGKGCGSVSSAVLW